MGNRYLLLVVLTIALGLGGRTEAAIVNGEAPVIFAFDLPSFSEEYTAFEAEGVSIECNTYVCASEWDWLYPTLDGDWIHPSDPRWDMYIIDWYQPRMTYTRPPESIVAVFGTAPGLNDIGTLREGGFDYLYSGRLSMTAEQYQNKIINPQEFMTMYITFINGEFDGGSIFYNVDKASLHFRAGDGDGSWWEASTIEGRLYVPFTPVPLPGSLLFILSAMAGALGLSWRKGRASHAWSDIQSDGTRAFA